MHYSISMNKIEIYILAVLIIISHTIYTYTNWNTFNYCLKILISLWPFIIIMVRSVYHVKSRTWKRMKVVCSIYATLVLIFMLANVRGSAINSFSFRFIIYLPGMLLLFVCFDGRKLFRAISDVITIIALFEFVFWIMFTVLRVVEPTGTLFVTWGDVYRDTYFGVYFEIPVNALRIPFYRNTGIYAEAPAFCFNLCVALLTEEFFYENSSRVKRLILVLCIVSTISTTGFMIFAYLIVVKIWDYMNEHSGYRFLKYGLILLVAVPVFILLYQLANDRSKMGSVLLRQIDYINGFNMWLSSPLLGYGYQYDPTIFNTGFSNSISTILINGGLVWALIFLIPFISVITIGIMNDKKLAYWGIGILALLSVCAVTYTYFIITVLAFGFSLIASGGSNSDNICNNPHKCRFRITRWI